MPTLDPKEPGLISRRFGSRRDGRQEVIEVWDMNAPSDFLLGERIVADLAARTFTRKFWISGIAESSVRLKEPA
jgi:hypothetical protein